MAMHALTLMRRDWRYTLTAEIAYRAEEPGDAWPLTPAAPEVPCSAMQHVAPSQPWQFGLHGQVLSDKLSVSLNVLKAVWYGWRMALVCGVTRFSVFRISLCSIANLQTLDLSERSIAEGLHGMHGVAMWTARAHEEMLLAARDPKQAFGISREACEHLEVDFSELSDAQLHARDAMGCAEWAALTLDELRMRLVIGEWAPC